MLVAVVVGPPAEAGARHHDRSQRGGDGDGGDQADAETFLGKLFANVKALPGSGRDATTAFQGGTGDVLISYENEAILARQQGEKIDYVVPDDIQVLAEPVLAHRLLLTADAQVSRRTAQEVVADLVERTSLPAARGR